MRPVALFAQFGRNLATKTRNCTEIKIPVPWGHIAAKWWGPGKNRPVVAVHGWQDNSGSFDTLIPLLPEHVEFLAIDMPGHGFSSAIPSGLYYFHMDYLILLRRLQKYFGWARMSLMGHSMGGMTVYYYGTTYPKEVDMLICIEGFRPLMINNLLEKRPIAIDNFLKYDLLRDLDESKRPSYPMDVMEKMWYEGARKSIDVDKCHYILKRNVAVSPDDPNKFCLTLDPRLKVGTLLNYPQDEVLGAAQRLKMPTVLIKASEIIYTQDLKKLKEVIDIMVANNPKFEEHVVEGKHHVHLNNPERLQEILTNFLNKYYKKEVNNYAIR